MNEHIYAHCQEFAGRSVRARSKSSVIKGVAMAISLVAGTPYVQTEAYVSRLVGSHLLHVETDPQAGENDLIFLIEDTLKIGL